MNPLTSDEQALYSEAHWKPKYPWIPRWMYALWYNVQWYFVGQFRQLPPLNEDMFEVVELDTGKECKWSKRGLACACRICRPDAHFPYVHDCCANEVCSKRRSEQGKAWDSDLKRLIREVEWIAHGHFCPVCTAEKCEGHFNGCQLKEICQLMISKP